MNQQNTNIPFAIPLMSETAQSASYRDTADAFLSSLSNQISYQQQEIAPPTELAYLKKAKQLIRTVRSELLEDKPSTIAGWFEIKKESIRPSTFRYYRAALIYLLTMKKNGDDKFIEEIDFAIETMKNLHPAKVILAKRTSAKKRKRVKKEEIDLLVSELNNVRGKWGKVSAAYIEAAIIVGARPCEWFGMKVIDRRDEGIVISIVTFPRKIVFQG
jgi:hypothetical protein